MCFQIASIVALHIDLTIGPSCPELHKWSHGFEDMSSHGSSKNDGLKKVKLEFPKHDVLKVKEIRDDLESRILKACCDKVMPSKLMKNLKECEEDSLWGFARRGPYYPRISHEKKNHGEVGDVLCTMWGRKKYRSII